LGQLDWSAFISLFWPFFILEVPRYALAALTVAGAELLSAPRPVPQVPPGRLTLLLPGHNEGPALRRSVETVREQTRPPDEIIVIDDGSTDDMRKQAQALRREGLVDLVLSTDLRGGKSSAANLGVYYATGDFVITTDIDTSFDRDAFARILEPFNDPKVGGVAGNLAVRNSHRSIMTAYQAIEYLITISLGRRISDMLNILFIISGAWAAFRREALIGVGGYEVGPGEDADLTTKLRCAGYGVRFAPHSWALTDVPETVLAYVKQRLRWSRSLIRFRMRKFGTVFNPFQARFSLINALGMLDLLFFQFILSLFFYVYVVVMAYFYGEFFLVILAAVTLYYTCLSVFQFMLAHLLSQRHSRLSLLPFVLTYGVFQTYLHRLVRLWAYLDELIFRRSYRDPYVPRRVLDNTEHF
jgi:cellulose synthase/poly-beta-1,6-N-acetylglucosamine synthase-like glycosyltransferase